MKSIQLNHPDKRLEVWFQDEARVGQQGRLTRVWGLRGQRQRLLKDFRFQYTYIYGAICPERDTGQAIVIDCVGKAAIHQHLQAISQCIPPDRQGVVVLDRAPWHRSLNVPANLTLLHLPSYSPELNPQEAVWAYLKNNFLSNTVFADLTALVEACCQAWNTLTSEVGRIASIGYRSWASLTDIY